MTALGTERIAVIGVAYPYRGGISHFSTLLVRELRRGHEVTFVNFMRQYPGILFPGKTQYDESAQKIFEPNERLIDSINPFTWRAVARRLNRERPALVVIQWWHPFFGLSVGTIVRLLDAQLRGRVCFLCHNVLPHEGSPILRVLTKYAFAPARFFIVHADEERRHLLALKPDAVVSKGAHPTYAEFGAGDAMGKAEARTALGIPEDRKTLLFFGLIRAYKGLSYLLEAMSTVLERMECTLLVVGECYDDKRKYLDLIEQRNLGDNVRFIDRYVPNEEVARYFNSADVVVLPYVSATQSGIVQIAFGLGTPVITTRVGGLPEAVEDGVTGLVVEPASSGALADAIFKYYDEGLESRFRAQIESRKDRFAWSEEIRLIDEFVAQARAS